MGEHGKARVLACLRACVPACLRACVCMRTVHTHAWARLMRVGGRPRYACSGCACLGVRVQDMRVQDMRVQDVRVQDVRVQAIYAWARLMRANMCVVGYACLGIYGRV